MKPRCLLSQTIPATLFILILVASQAGQAAPANDLFAKPTVITGTNILVSGSNVGATLEAGEPSHAGSPGGASIWWSWTAPFSGFVWISTEGSTFDTTMAVYIGSSVSNLTRVGYNDDAGYPDIITSAVYFDVTAGKEYAIAVDGYSGGTGDVRLFLYLGPFPGAPSWSLPDPYGFIVHSSNYAGKVVLLNFWATWCGPCTAELPDLVNLQKTYGADGLVIVGASTDSSSAPVLTFLATYSPAINYQIVMVDSAMSIAYGGISAIPTTFLIDRQNIVRKRYVGRQTASTFESSIRPLLYGNIPLRCQREGDSMSLRWPANMAALTLQWTTNLTNPSWQWSTLSPTVVNGTNLVTIAPTGAPRYFRLKMLY